MSGKTKTAYLSNNGSYSYFKVGKEVVKFITSPYLEKYVKIKEWDKGYLVVDIKLSTKDNIDEDYLDIESIFEEICLDTSVLNEIEEVVIL